MNIRNTTAKERMLKNVRQALLEKRDKPYPDFEDSPLYKDEEEGLDVTFARELSENRGNFVYCDGELSIIENLIGLVEELGATKVYAWEPAVQALLDHYGFPIFKDDSNFSTAEIGITTCEALIARNGSILVSNDNRAGRRLSAYPAIHIVLAKASQLVMDVKHAMALIKDRYNNQLPSMLSIITGPSCTTNIEKQVVAGSQGPNHLYVFLVEDRF